MKTGKSIVHRRHISLHQFEVISEVLQRFYDVEPIDLCSMSFEYLDFQFDIYGLIIQMIHYFFKCTHLKCEPLQQVGSRTCRKDRHCRKEIEINNRNRRKKRRWKNAG
jgi:hypothetical protein